MKPIEPRNLLPVCAYFTTLALILGLTASPVWANPITGDFTVVDGAIRIKDETPVVPDQFEFRLGENIFEESRIDFWHDNRGEWVWSFGTTPTDVMSLDSSNKLSLYDLGASSEDPAIILNPGNPDAPNPISPSIMVGNDEVLTVANSPTLLGGTFVNRSSINNGSNDSLLMEGVFGGGADIPTQGAGSRMMWYPEQAVFRAGLVTGSQWDEANTGQYSVAMGYNTTASGANSFAHGSQTSATGSGSVAFGTNSHAGGNNSFAVGEYSQAYGHSSFAAGSSNAHASNSVALGMGTDAVGDSSFTTGMWSFAMGSASSAFGMSSAYGGYSFSTGTGTASGFASVSLGSAQAFGDYSTALSEGYAAGNYSFASGGQSQASDDYAFAAGESVSAEGRNSVAFGRFTMAVGDASFVSGEWSGAWGNYATALGSAGADGDYSAAMGYAYAQAYASIALGAGWASGDYSVAIGGPAESRGYGSIALSEGIANGDYSMAFGPSGTESTSYSSLAVGRYNEDRYDEADLSAAKNSWQGDDQHSVLEVGVGADSNNRANALTVLQDGSVEVGKDATDGSIPLQVKSDGSVVLAKPQGDISMGNFQ